MRQSRLFRLLGAFLMPLYSTGAWIAPALQVCPMHGSPAAAHSGSTAASGEGPHAHHAMHEAADNSGSVETSGATVAVDGEATPSVQSVEATMDAPVAITMVSTSEQSSVDNSSAPSHSHGCDCLGCCASPTGPGVPSSQVAFALTVEQNARQIEIDNIEAEVARLAHVLPFATAPPSTLV